MQLKCQKCGTEFQAIDDDTAAVMEYIAKSVKQAGYDPDKSKVETVNICGQCLTKQFGFNSRSDL